MLPSRVPLSKKATDKLRYLKIKTGLTLNILSRVAIMLAIKESNILRNAGVNDYDGQVLSRDVMFGDHQDTYAVMIKEYLIENNIQMGISEAITALIEVGVFKIGHVKSLADLAKV